MTTLTFPARFEYLDEIRQLVAEVARQSGFSDKEIYSLQLAADEAASNIIEHAYAGVADARFEVACEERGGALVITMRDTGKSFNLSSVKEPNVRAGLSKRKIGGLGVYLMRQLMDEVKYQSIGAENVLTMTKRKA
ncbi:MAG: hypothetical protein Fur002_03820 [Anaerolineales bacterium]